MIIKYHSQYGRFYFESTQEFDLFISTTPFYQKDDFSDASEQEMIQFMKDSKEMQ